MANKPICAIAVFNDKIKGDVKFTEDLVGNQIRIDLNITGLHLLTFQTPILRH